MKAPSTLFRELMLTAPFQPATNLWRAVELDAVQRHGLPGGLGLDLGCGDGKLTAIIDGVPPAEGTRRRWVGIDIDPLETAQAKALGLYERVLTGSAAQVPEPDGHFDFVFSNSVLEHIPPIEEVLREAARVLRPGGRFIATVPGPGFHRALRGPLFGGDREAYLGEVDARCLHLRYWSAEQWRDSLARCGLSLTAHAEYLSPTQTRRWELLSSLTGGLLYRLHGRTRRPIEIQRSLGLRVARPGPLGRAMSALAPVLSAGCRLEAPHSAENGEGACLLIDATKR